MERSSRVGWQVRYAAARIDAGLPVTPWHALAVQMMRHGGHGYQ